MTAVTNPIVQAVHDAVEAAIAAMATELSQAVGFVGPATADQIRNRVEQLKDTLSQLFTWVSDALKVVQAAYAVNADPSQLPALIAALEQYRQARAVQPAPPVRPPVLPVPSPWLSALDEALSALQVGDDRYGAEIAGLERLRAELADGVPEIDAVGPKWPDATERMWASLLAQVDAEPDCMTRGDDDLPGVEFEVVGKPPAEIEVIVEIDAHGLMRCIPPGGVRVRVFDCACQDGAETYLFTSGGEVERQPLAADDAENTARGWREHVRELSVFSLCDPDHAPLACLIMPTDQIADSLIAQLETQAAHYGQIVIEDQGTDRAYPPDQALIWIA